MYDHKKFWYSFVVYFVFCVAALNCLLMVIFSQSVHIIKPNNAKHPIHTAIQMTQEIVNDGVANIKLLRKS